jgi:hypothetical protein
MTFDDFSKTFVHESHHFCLEVLAEKNGAGACMPSPNFRFISAFHDQWRGSYIQSQNLLSPQKKKFFELLQRFNLLRFLDTG